MVTVMTYRSRSYFPLLFNKYIIHHNFCPKFHLKKPSTLWLLSPLILSQIKCWLHSKQVCFHLLILLLKYLSNHAEKIQNTRSNKNVKFFWRKPFSVETPSLGEKSFLGRSHFWGEALFGEKPFSGRSHSGEKPLKKSHVPVTPLLSPLCTVTMALSSSLFSTSSSFSG